MTPERFTVKSGTTVFTVFPWKHGSGEIHWRWKDNHGKAHTRKDPEKARSDAKKMAQLVQSKRKDLNKLPEDQIEAVHKLLDAGLNAALVNDFLEYWKAKGPAKTLHTVIGEFLAVKEANRGGSSRNVDSLSSDLGSMKKHFTASTRIADVTVSDLEEWLKPYAKHSAKRRQNLRGSAVTLFRWARKRDYLPDRTTAAEKLERPKVTRKVPPTYEPEEALKMLRAAPEEYLPWLLVQGWDGLRFEEVFPRKAKSGPQKRPFDWSDMLWSRNLIEVKAETAKTGERRVIPMDPMLRAILEPLAKKSGPIAEGLVPPSKKPKRGESLTTTLGKLVGGWKPNGLRNSFISNRAALVGLAKTAAEAGNSESEARKSYNDSKSEEEGKAWFAILGELLRTRFPRNRKPADLQRVS